MSLSSAAQMEKLLFLSNCKQEQVIELRRQKAETLSISLVFSWKLTRSCVTQSSLDETGDWLVSTSLTGTLSLQAPSIQYVLGSINNGSMTQYCCVFWGISRVSVKNNESPGWECAVIAWRAKNLRSHWQKKKTFSTFYSVLRPVFFTF